MNEELITQILMIGAGIYSASHAIYQYITDRRALRWPTVAGQIETSEVSGEWDSSSSNGGLKFSKMYSAVIEYSYEVNGIEYHGDRFRSFKVSTTGPSGAEATCSRFPVGKKVNVLYNPQQPSKSLLPEAAFNTGLLILILFLSIGLITGGAIWMSKS